MTGLDRTQLKIIAIAAMVCDHIAWGFVEFMSPLGQFMHIIGRFTLPIMCFFIAEGFGHTSSKKGYIMSIGSSFFGFCNDRRLGHYAHALYPCVLLRKGL